MPKDALPDHRLIMEDVEAQVWPRPRGACEEGFVRRNQAQRGPKVMPRCRSKTFETGR